MTNERRTSLKALLKDRGLTQRQLAVALDTTEPVVSNWCRGLKPGPQSRERIAKKLKLTEAEIRSLGWEEEKASV